MIHNVQVYERVITITRNPDIVQNGVEADTIVVAVDKEWQSVDSAVIVFTNGDTSIYCDFDFTSTTIPWEVLEKSGKLYITLIGYEGETMKVITEKMEEPFTVKASGTDFDDAEEGRDPSPSIIQQIQEELDNKLDKNDYDINLPNKSGTIALLSDVTTPTDVVKKNESITLPEGTWLYARGQGVTIRSTWESGMGGEDATLELTDARTTRRSTLNLPVASSVPPTWVYEDQNGNEYEISHPGKAGTIALLDDISGGGGSSTWTWLGKRKGQNSIAFPNTYTEALIMVQHYDSSSNTNTVDTVIVNRVLFDRMEGTSKIMTFKRGVTTDFSFEFTVSEFVTLRKATYSGSDALSSTSLSVYAR